MINVVRTTVEGRNYEVVADSDKKNEPMFSYLSIYRIRKDGSRGRRLMSHREEAWAVWSTVKASVKALEG